MKRTKARRASGRGAYLQSILFLALLACVFALGARLLNGADSTQFENAVLQYVVDGDTIDVTVQEKEMRVRLIGIDTPESVSRTQENTPQGESAAEYLRSRIRPGDPLYLEYDTQRFDPYGRTLAYVWLAPDADTGSQDDFRAYNLNAVIYQNTYCRLLTVPPNDKYADWFAQLTPFQENETSAAAAAPAYARYSRCRAFVTAVVTPKHAAAKRN